MRPKLFLITDFVSHNMLSLQWEMFSDVQYVVKEKCQNIIIKYWALKKHIPWVVSAVIKNSSPRNLLSLLPDTRWWIAE